MPTGTTTWKVGTLTVPSSTGDVAVTGLGGEPAAVFFWGTNWLAEDSIDTTTGWGLFRGMAAPKYDDGSTIVQNAACTSPPGNYYLLRNNAILMQTPPSGAPDFYRASLTSFDSDGFTVNFDIAQSGGYKVVYAALMDNTNVGGYVGTSNTVAMGWKAGAGLIHGGFGGPLVGHLDHSGSWYGGGAYPGTGGGDDWQSAGLSANTYPDSASAQYIIGVYNDAAGTHITDGVDFIGPFLTPSNVTMIPGGTGLQSVVANFTASNGGMFVAWDDEASATGRFTPSQDEDDTDTVSGLSFNPALLVGYTISNEPQGQSTGGRGAIGMSVVADGFQWCATIDGTSYGAYQSFQRGFVDTVTPTTVHAGTVELRPGGFLTTTVEDTATASPWAWHVFGSPPRSEAMWVPNIYRRVNAA